MGLQVLLSVLTLLSNYICDANSQLLNTVLSTITGLLPIVNPYDKEKDLPNYPSELSPPERIIYENWATERRVNSVWKINAKNASDVVTITNYAHSLNMHVRPSGFMHTWSPLIIENSKDARNIILVDLRLHMNDMVMSSTDPEFSSVLVETGTSMETLLTFLENNGKGIFAFPAPGDLTVGGVLAINGHGTGILAHGQNIEPGHTLGTLSNLILSFTAVVWNPQHSSYQLKTFYRNETDAKGFLTNLGKTILTQVELRVGPNYSLRCVSYVDISSSELFAHPSTVTNKTRTFSKFVDSHGRVETILFPWTTNPWLKVWSVSPDQPEGSRKVTHPFNYVFSDNVPSTVARLLGLVQSGLTFLGPTLAQLLYVTTVEGLAATNTYDIWGTSKNVLLYIKPSTLRVTANGYAVLTTRANIQNVVSKFYSYYNSLISEFDKKLQYPANGPMEIRVTGLDHPCDVGILNGKSPTLSAARPDDRYPEYDVAIWLDVLSFPNTAFNAEFMLKMESFLMQTFHNHGCTVRPEWSKGWAYTGRGPWTNTEYMKQIIPHVFSTRSSHHGWVWAKSNFEKYDPHNVFSNTFLRNLLN